MPFSYHRSPRFHKLVPKHLLCPRCSTYRLVERHGICHSCLRDIAYGRAALKFCPACNTNLLPPGAAHCPACTRQIVLDRAKELVLPKLQQIKAKVPNKRPPAKQPPNPSKWMLDTCWNCTKEKGALVPKISIYCEECYFHACHEVGCKTKAQWIYTEGDQGYYRDYCEEHYFQRLYCRKCGNEKEFSGLDFCQPCSDYFARMHSRMLQLVFNKQWRAYHSGSDQLCIRCKREPQLHEGYCRACLEAFGRAAAVRRIPKPPRLDTL